MALQALILPSVEYLLECFNYEHSTGTLCWRHRPSHHFVSASEQQRWNARFAETTAGHTHRGYRRIQLGIHTYVAHRVIWKLTTKNEPPPNIDHINGRGLDNRFVNLCAADQTKQNWNRKLHRNNKSGYRGVVQHRDKWRAVIKVNGVQKHLGLFPTAAEAAVVYDVMARNIHGEFYRRCRK